MATPFSALSHLQPQTDENRSSVLFAGSILFGRWLFFSWRKKKPCSLAALLHITIRCIKSQSKTKTKTTSKTELRLLAAVVILACGHLEVWCTAAAHSHRQKRWSLKQRRNSSK